MKVKQQAVKSKLCNSGPSPNIHIVNHELQQNYEHILGCSDGSGHIFAAILQTVLSLPQQSDKDFQSGHVLIKFTYSFVHSAFFQHRYVMVRYATEFLEMAFILHHFDLKGLSKMFWLCLLLVKIFFSWFLRLYDRVTRWQCFG